MGQQINSLVFQPPEVSYSQAHRPLIWLKTVHGSQIPAFYLNRQAKITLLFSHGNAEDLGLIFEWFVYVSSELNVNVFAYEYDGYGKSMFVHTNSNPPSSSSSSSTTATATPTATMTHSLNPINAPTTPVSPASRDNINNYQRIIPSEQSCYHNIDAAFDYLVNELHHAPENIILYGRSLGSGPTVYLAERLSEQKIVVGGVILQSPLLSIYRVVIPFRWTLFGDQFPNIDRIHRIQAPIFIIHGTRDEIIPFDHGEDLFLATKIEYRVKPLWIDGGGHNNLEAYLGEATFADQLREFLLEWVPAYRKSTERSRGSTPLNLSRDKSYRRPML